MITFDGVSKAYRTREGYKTIVRDVSCEIPDGCNLGILGINGAGKSTVMRMIAGVEHPDRGRIRRTARVSFPLGFSGTFAGSLSGRENAIFLARVYGADTKYVIDYTNDFSELGDYFDMPVKTYSSGMMARLAFGVSIAIDFDVYLVDEITGVGDARVQARCKDVLTERFRHSDVIMISHDPGTLQQYCNCGAVLIDGQMYFFDSIEEAGQAHIAAMNLRSI